MATRHVVIEGDEILRKVSEKVEVFDKELGDLLTDMRKTMHETNGCGIAGVQVGVLKRLFIVEVDGMFLECVNPEIISQSGAIKGYEGCLSVPKKKGEVIRPETLTLKAQTRTGVPFEITVNGFMARAICHENDHLDGILYIDKVVGPVISNEEYQKIKEETSK